MVIKRNGKTVPFNKQKIINAINNAFIEVDGELYETDTSNDIANEIETNYKTNLSVETIQDLIEDYLMRSERRDVAKAYIRYRYKKEVARNQKDDFVKAFETKILATDVENSNANMDERSFGGRSGSASSFANKEYALNYMLSDMAKNNHLNNMIYIHDLDHYILGDHNCLSCPLDQLLENGFKVRQVDIRPAGSLSTAMQLIAVIFQVQSLCQFGGVSGTHVDWTLVPYVRKSFAKHYKNGLKYIEGIDEETINIDVIGVLLNNAINHSIDDNKWKVYSEQAYNYAIDMTKKEAHQSAEALFHNLNSLQSRSGNQLKRMAG